MLIRIAWQSLRNRMGAAVLTLLSIMLSVALLVSIEQLRQQAKDSFSRTVSGVDLIVGARTGQTNLLLYSVFRIGNPANNVSWDSIETLRELASVDWLIPISLGDSHSGFAVIGTSEEYFSQFRYADKQALQFQHGKGFSSPFEAVLGAEVAKTLNYQLGDEIVLAHGMAQVSFTQHAHSPFKVAGILRPTGTPVDKTVHVSLQGLEVAHMSEAQAVATLQQYQQGAELDIQVKAVTAAYLGLKSKLLTLQLQRGINQYAKEPLTAIMPAVTLTELWQVVGNVEKMLLFVSVLVLLSALLGLATMLLTSIRERRHELAVLRAIGASPWHIFGLIQAEAMLLCLSASGLAFGVVWAVLMLAAPWLSARYGVFIDADLINQQSLLIVLSIVAMTFLITCIPAIKAYRDALHQGLTQR